MYVDNCLSLLLVSETVLVSIIEHLRSLGWGEELDRMVHRVLDLGELPSVAKACQKDVTDHGEQYIFFSELCVH